MTSIVTKTAIAIIIESNKVLVGPRPRITAAWRPHGSSCGVGSLARITGNGSFVMIGGHFSTLRDSDRLLGKIRFGSFLLGIADQFPMVDSFCFLEQKNLKKLYIKKLIM